MEDTVDRKLLEEGRLAQEEFDREQLAEYQRLVDMQVENFEYDMIRGEQELARLDAEHLQNNVPAYQN